MKKLLSAALSSIIALQLLTGSVFATDATANPVEATPISAETGETETPPKLVEGYKSITGTIIGTTQDDLIMMRIEDEDGNPSEVVVTGSTYIFKDVKLEMEQKITAFYDISKPMVLIYPPRYNAAVIAPADMEENVFVGRFDENLISLDNQLKLNMSDDVEVISADGTAFTGDLGGRRLAVVYTISTRSIPAQTTPKQVIVLPEDPEQPAEVPEEPEVSVDVSTLDIVVKGNKIDAPAAYETEDKVLMLPVSAIAQALGYEVTWDGATSTVRLGNAISFQVGTDYYTFAKMAPIYLGTAPVIKDGRTYVPSNFFTEVIAGAQVNVTNHAIEITQY